MIPKFVYDTIPFVSNLSYPIAAGDLEPVVLLEAGAAINGTGSKYLEAASMVALEGQRIEQKSTGVLHLYHAARMIVMENANYTVEMREQVRPPNASSLGRVGVRV